MLLRTSPLAVISLLCAVAALASEPVREEGGIDAMGSVFTVAAYGASTDQARAAIRDAVQEAKRLDDMLSNYKPHSEWSEMNRRAAYQAVHVSDELFDLLAKCIEYSRESEGAFDVSVGPLMRVWGFYKGTGRLASQPERARALQLVGSENIILDGGERTVRFSKPGVELDPGGIGKGYAVDRMVEILRRAGIRNAFVSAAGSSIYALGAPPGEDGWLVTLNDPRIPSHPAATVCLRDESLSTSGSYEKFFIADGRRWSHIMDPRTGLPAQGMAQVSVIAPKTMDSEAWTKPYFVRGRDWAERHRHDGFRIFLCEDAPEKACSWI